MSNIEYNIIYLTHGPTILIYQDPPKLGHQQVQVESLYQITNQLAIAGVLILEDPTKTPWKSPQLVLVMELTQTVSHYAKRITLLNFKCTL